MVHMRLLPLLLLIVYPLYIQGFDNNGRDLRIENGLKKSKNIENLMSMVQEQTDLVKTLTEVVESQGEMIQEQQKNIRDLRKNLAQQEKKIDKSLALLHEANGKCRDQDENWSTTISQESYTVIQKRFNGSVDFFRGWEEYAEGFGDPAGEHWLGLQHIHGLTKAQPMELIVGLTDFDVGRRYAKYGYFSVSSEDDKFRLHIGNYSGTAGDSLKYHNGQQFSTRDQDNDSWQEGSCCETRHGAWWYNSCDNSNLNVRYSKFNVKGPEYMKWMTINHDYRSMKASVMMIRPANFRL